MVKLLLYLTLLAFLASCKHEEVVTVQQKKLPSRKMIDAFSEVQYGNMPLIISVPHGGILTPTEIPDRTCPGSITEPDDFTIELLKAIDSVSEHDYRFQPYFLYTNLSRIKLDLNRSLAEGTCNNPDIAVYWNNYHAFIDSCINRIIKSYPLCLFIDLHGHGHTIQRLELGYLIPAGALREPSSINPAASSLCNLLNYNPTLDISNLISGPDAFGTLLANLNYASVPSLQDPAPLAEDIYFSGGYNTRHYCSDAYPQVFGWQTETNLTGIRDNAANRVTFAKAFMQSVMHFFKTSAGMEPEEFGQ